MANRSELISLNFFGHDQPSHEAQQVSILWLLCCFSALVVSAAFSPDSDSYGVLTSNNNEGVDQIEDRFLTDRG